MSTEIPNTVPQPESEKPFADIRNLLLALTEQEILLVSDWLLSGLPFHTVAKMVESEFGFLPNVQQLAEFWDEKCRSGLVARRGRAASAAEDIVEHAKRWPEYFTEAAIDALRQRSFELLIAPKLDTRAVKELLNLLLKVQSQHLEERRLAIHEKQLLEKAQRADAIAKDTTISPEERERRMKEIFGI